MFDISILNEKELAVYSLIKGLDAGVRITQLQIAQRLGWLGRNEKYEDNLPTNKNESTLRQVRDIIHTLRMKHDAPIISDNRGFGFPHTREEKVKFLQDKETFAKNQAKSHMSTYYHMKKVLDINDYYSEYFEGNNQQSLFD